MSVRYFDIIITLLLLRHRYFIQSCWGRCENGALCLRRRKESGRKYAQRVRVQQKESYERYARCKKRKEYCHAIYCFRLSCRYCYYISLLRPAITPLLRRVAITLSLRWLLRYILSPLSPLFSCAIYAAAIMPLRCCWLLSGAIHTWNHYSLLRLSVHYRHYHHTTIILILSATPLHPV